MSVKVLTSAAREELRAAMQREAKAAAGTNDQVSKDEQVLLGPYLDAKAQELRMLGGKGARVRVEPLVEYALGAAMDEWSLSNPPFPASDGRYLSRTEVKDIGRRSQQGLGLLTVRAYDAAKEKALLAQFPVVAAINFSSDHPGATLTKTGPIYELRSDTSGAVSSFDARRTATLEFEGHSIELRAGLDGRFLTHDLDQRVPEGFYAMDLGAENTSTSTVAKFLIGRDAPGTLSLPAALDLARQGLVDYVRDVRMHQPDWQTSLVVPDTWDGLVAVGILDELADFSALGVDDASEHHRRRDHYLFTGRGPFDLYTEVEIDKKDGSMKRAYIEID